MSHVLVANPVCLLVDKSADETFSNTCDLGAVYSDLTLQVVCSATLGAGVVQIQGSLDGENWDATNVIATSGSLAGVSGTKLVHATGKPVRYIRARIETAVTDGTVTVFAGAA